MSVVRATAAGVFLLVALLAGAPGAALAQPVILRFEPAVVELGAVGARARVSLVAEGVPASGLAAFQVEIGFASAALSLENPNEAYRGLVPAFAPLGGEAATCVAVRGVSPCPDPPWKLTASGRLPIGTDRAGADTLLFAYATSGATAPPDGTGAIGLIDVVAQTPVSSLVSLTATIVANAADPPVAFPVLVEPLAVIVGSGFPDQDNDGMPDSIDNCTSVENGPAAPDPLGGIQRDGDRDGFGNACDADLNNDGFVDFLDLGVFKSAFFSTDPAADLNGDGFVDFSDLGVMKTLFFRAPGPSGRTP